MKLYLSSDRVGAGFDELVRWAGPGARTAVIGNALDLVPQVARDAYALTVFDPVADFRARGLDAHWLDLRTFFGQPDAMAEALAAMKLVWCVGGNTFLLRRAMRQSGFDRLAPDLVRAGKLIYGGWSAGACVAGPDLRGMDLMDRPDEVASGYDPEPVCEGLGLVDIRIVPHFGSCNPEAPAAQRVADYMAAEGLPHRTLRDGEALLVNGAESELRSPG